MANLIRKTLNALDRSISQPMSRRAQKALDWFCYIFMVAMILSLVDWFVTELAR